MSIGHECRVRGHVVCVALGSLLALAGCEKQAAPEEPTAEAPADPTAEAPDAPEGAEQAEGEAPQAGEETAAAGEQAGSVTVSEGFQTPESILHDAEADYYLVSNINGQPIDADGNGFISKVDPTGKVLELKFIDGEKEGITLNAPKGMALAGGLLYVTDIDTVRMFDAKTGEAKGEVAIEGATFLNDIAAGADGTIYVSDSGMKAGEKGLESSGSQAVYKLAEGKAEALIKGKTFDNPNGLFVDGQALWAVTYSKNELFPIADGKKGEAKTLPKGSLDGIAKTTDGRLLVSSWEAKAVFVSGADGQFTEMISNVQAPADIGYDAKRNRVLIPLFLDNSIRFEPVAAAAPAPAPATDKGEGAPTAAADPKADST